MATFLRRDDWVTDAMGNALSGASVYVCSQPATTTGIPPSPLVQLYSDPAGAFPITQPVITDGYGHAAYYVTPGTYTVVYYSPQILETILPDQTIGSGNVAFPITVAQGGTNATNAPQALINLGAAGSGTNADITSLTAIPNSKFAGAGWQYGAGSFGTSNTVFIANQSWTGTGYTGPAVVSGDSSGNFALVGNTGFFTSGTVQGNFIKSLGNMQVQGPSGVLSVNTITAYNPGTALSLLPSGVVGAGSVGVQVSGNGTLGQALLGFASYPTQTTVGAAGAASALPATPSAYLQVKVGSTVYVLPLYLPV